MQKFPRTIGLQSKWEAIEENLYQEESSSPELSPRLINECKLWKESFPYLRVRGRRIDHPLNQKKTKLRQQVITTVVDQLIEKISGEGLDLSRDKQVQRPAAPSKESYFERGKVKKPSTQLEANPLPRGILKNSPKRIEVKERRKPKRNSTSFRNSSLPRISQKNNNWLARSERRSGELALPPKEKIIILPPIAQKFNSK